MKKRPSSGTWPASHWQKLLRQAIRVLDSVSPPVAWTFGGGSALALHLSHRISYDADIFLYDAQRMAALSPRLNDTSASLGGTYAEAAHYLKITLPDGDVDFIVSADVTAAPHATFPVPGLPARAMLVQSAAEILARKIRYRGDMFTARDMFDLAVLIERDRGSVDTAFAACQGPALAVALDRMHQRLPTLSADLPEYVNPTPAFAGMIARAPKLIAGYIG